MRQAFLQTMALVGLFLAGRFLYMALASDETRVRWVIERMVEGFNDTRASPCLDGFATSYVDTSSGADRETVHRALAYLFFTRKDETTKKFLYEVEMPENDLSITVVDGDAPTATAEGVARFFEVHGEERKLAWEVRFRGELAEGDDGWQFVRTTHETSAGTRLR
jgi:hypothetical protein